MSTVVRCGLCGHVLGFTRPHGGFTELTWVEWCEGLAESRARRREPGSEDDRRSGRHKIFAHLDIDNPAIPPHVGLRRLGADFGVAVVGAHCTKCGEEYAAADLIDLVIRARRKGKTSGKLHPRTLPDRSDTL